MTPTSMTIQIAEDILTDLQARLARLRVVYLQPADKSPRLTR
jgi:hypothetical protein